jgi:hypothetical protein
VRGKPKGPFRKGKYVLALKTHLKARHDKAGSHLDLTIRLGKDNAKILLKQIKVFLDELEK